MKITIVGAGAHRVLGILRSALAIPGVLDGGQVYLCDLNVGRAEVMGRLLLESPEQRRAGAVIRWGDSLEAALEGADVVGVILPASRPKSFALGNGASLRHGFIGSDNVSPNGALCAVKIAPVLLKIGRMMERVCPRALLVNFVNPVAVLSGMINNHTSIPALGVCQGFTNHLWDIPRLFGRDEEATALEVQAAGINHLSYILKGSWEGQDLFAALKRRLESGWQAPELQAWWGERGRRNILNSVSRLVRFWRELGVLVFSTEGDGMDHLMYEEAVAAARDQSREPSQAELDGQLAKEAAEREKSDRSFAAWLGRGLDAEFWDRHWMEDSRFKCQDEDIFVRVFAARAGIREAKIVTSRPNHGAIKGIKDRHVVEYSQSISRDGIQAMGTYEIPDVVHGLTASLAAHQTLLGDALAEEDPRMLAHALMSYPIQPYSTSARSLYRELFALGAAEIKDPYGKAVDFL